MIPDDSVNLIVIDPPYNIGKDKRWDKWKTVDAYVDWMVEVFSECERVLAPNGSFYYWHNDFEQIAELQRAISNVTGFVFKQLIVWNKRFEGASNKGFLDGFVEVGGLRNYQQMAEYCLFYTLQDESEGSPCLRIIQDYIESHRKKAGVSYEDLNAICGYKAIARKWCTDYKQPRLIQRKDYEKIAGVLGLQETYDKLLEKYESAKYTYNNRKTSHSVWNYEIAPKQGHITPKPVDMIENIIRHSSNAGDIVLDCFMGSGTTAVAAVRSGRKFIGFEREPEYIEIANKRLDNEEEID